MAVLYMEVIDVSEGFFNDWKKWNQLQFFFICIEWLKKLNALSETYVNILTHACQVFP